MNLSGNCLKFTSHDVNRCFNAICSLNTSGEILRILPILVIDVRVAYLKFQMHNIYFQNIQGLYFLLMPMKPLYLDGAGRNSSLNFDTFHFHNFTFSHFSHIRYCFMAKWVLPSCSAPPITLPDVYLCR